MKKGYVSVYVVDFHVSFFLLSLSNYKENCHAILLG